MSFKLFNHAWDAEVPTQSHQLVLMKLVDCCDDDGKNIFPKIRTVAKAAKCSERHVQRVIGEFRRIGLLRLVKEGGRGQDNPSLYEMDIELLVLLRRTDTWPALMAAAGHRSIDDRDELSRQGGDGDEAESHARDACNEDGEADDSALPKGDTRSPLDRPGVTWETAKGDKLSHPHIEPLNNPSVEREGARAQAGRPASEGEPAETGHAADAGASARGPATLAAFRQTYPHAGADDQAQVIAAWEALPFTERWPAIDGIPGFLAERKAAGFSSRLSAPKYLSGRNWQHVPRQVAERAAAQQASAFVEVKGWSKEWWLILLLRIAEGQRQKVSFALQQAEAHKSLSVSAGDLAAAARRIGELKSFVCSGPEIEAWRPWLAERGARIPVFEGNFRVFLPGEAPPGGRSDAGDDEVKF